MQRPAGVDAEAWLRQYVNRAQAVPMDETLKANYLADLAILSGLVYKAESLSLAMLEILVNLDSAATLDRYLSIPVEFDHSLCKVLALDGASNPVPPNVQEMGSRWAAGRESAVLVVSSAIVLQEHNFLLNPQHPGFAQIRIGHSTEFNFDQRLIREF